MGRVISYNRAIQEAIAEEMERDDAVFLMGEDVAGYGGVFGLSRGLYKRFGPRRVFDTPLSETLIVGAGVGAAITGLRPIVELQFADFVAVAMDEIYNKAAKWRYMHGGQYKVPLVILMPEGAAGGAGPEHSQCPEALFWSAPGLYVITPATPADAKGLLKTAIREDNPVVFLPHKALSNTTGEVPEGEHLVPFGRAEIRRAGRDLTIVAWSIMVGKSLAAAERLAEAGFEAEVIDARGVRPFDFETVIASVQRTGRLLLAHEAPIMGGPGAEVAAVVAERAITALEGPIRRVGAPDTPIPQSQYLERLMVPQIEDVIRVAREMLGASVAA